MDPIVASAVILAGGGVLLAACAIVVVRNLRAPALDRARLDAVERSQRSEAERMDRLVGEAHKAAIDARRIAASRRVKIEREPEPEEEPAAEPEPARGPREVFRPGCDRFGNPVSMPAAEPGAQEKLAARGLAVRDGKIVRAG